jgi:hypothetical protein
MRSIAARLIWPTVPRRFERLSVDAAASLEFPALHFTRSLQGMFIGWRFSQRSRYVGVGSVRAQSNRHSVCPFFHIAFSTRMPLAARIIGLVFDSGASAVEVDVALSIVRTVLNLLPVPRRTLDHRILICYVFYNICPIMHNIEVWWEVTFCDEFDLEFDALPEEVQERNARSGKIARTVRPQAWQAACRYTPTTRATRI